jgi:predicted nucleic acid-binding protein
MKLSDPCLVDSSVWIDAEREPARFAAAVKGHADVATCLAAVTEFAVGVYAPAKEKTREAARLFLDRQIAAAAWHAHLPDDFAAAARLVGAAIRRGKAKPSFADGLIAACATRLGRVVWTLDTSHFTAMGAPALIPFSKHPAA